MVTDAPLIVRFPATVTDPVTVTSPAVEFMVKERDGFVAVTAEETVMAPAVVNVAFADPIWFWRTVGVTREVPNVAVYQVPSIQDPVASTTPDASTVIDCGKPLVLAEVFELSVESW
jgi:hypothetical protein